MSLKRFGNSMSPFHGAFDQLSLAWVIILFVVSFLALAHMLYKQATHGPVPVSVNYHFTRKCNKECGFCFHTAKTSHIATLEEARRGLALLKAAGMRKLNFAGGEPFLYPKHMGKSPTQTNLWSCAKLMVPRELAVFSKQTLRLESVSIVSNGSLIKKSWLDKYGRHIDILAISCDSFNEQTNIKIGRGSGDNVRQLFQIRDWCKEYGIKFKLNTVVCRYNFDENMAAQVADLAPFRWKAFQVLKVEGENDSEDTLRDVRRFEIDDDEFMLYCSRHEHLPCFVPESNKVMAESYLVLDEYLRFLSGTNKNILSGSILEVGVQRALREIRWDQEAFHQRSGVYEWTKDELGSAGEGCSSEVSRDLDW